ncbi:MAG: RNA methyltransferase [Bacteroidales bacterium]
MRKLSMDELNRLDINQFKNAQKIPLIVVLDNIRSLSNIGSVFRTADAFLVEAVWLCGITAKPPHREIHKTALGSTESVEWKYYETTKEAVMELRKLGYKIIGIEQTDKSVLLPEFESEAKTAIIFGNEVEGVENEIVDLCDTCVEIPQHGTKHSLNVSVCAGIVIWHCFRQME